MLTITHIMTPSLIVLHCCNFYDSFLYRSQTLTPCICCRMLAESVVLWSWTTVVQCKRNFSGHAMQPTATFQTYKCPKKYRQWPIFFHLSDDPKYFVKP